MIIFESRKTRHLGFVSLEALRSWGISLDFHPTYRKALAQHLLDLSKVGFDVVLESDSINFLNYFGDQIERGLVSKDDFRVHLEVEKDGRPYFINLKYDDNGVLNGTGEDVFPIGYFN